MSVLQLQPRCGSCGWRHSVLPARQATQELARHLATCDRRDDGRYVPRWRIQGPPAGTGQIEDFLEGCWTVVDHDGIWHPFVAAALRAINGDLARTHP